MDGDTRADGHDEVTPGERTFEQIMGELESITERLAVGDLGIEEAADLFERAEGLHAQATERLDQVRARIETLTTGSTAPATPGE
jgi:exodeoxyribonuclease VII small subunit